jgi:hypothetical protein
MSCADCLSNPNAYGTVSATSHPKASYRAADALEVSSAGYREADAPEISRVDYVNVNAPKPGIKPGPGQSPEAAMASYDIASEVSAADYANASDASVVEYRTAQEMNSVKPTGVGAQGSPPGWQKKVLLAQAEVHRPTTEHMKNVLRSFGHHGGGLSTSRQPHPCGHAYSLGPCDSRGVVLRRLARKYSLPCTTPCTATTYHHCRGVG